MKNMMPAQRKVREDFNPAKEYSVNVEGCTEEERKEVQQAFFDAGFLWAWGGKEHRCLNSDKYTNTTSSGVVRAYLMYGGTSKGCNMTAKEFLEIVYEPERVGHIHAESMAQYAEDAKITDKPWELWEFKSVEDNWLKLNYHPSWDITAEYRHKQKTHIVHGVEVPDLRIEPKIGERYLLADPTDVGFNKIYTNTGDSWDAAWVSRGLCYAPTEEGKMAAILHAKAMLGIA